MTDPTDKLRATYDATAKQYRRDDEIAVTGEDHKQICGVLRGICESFPHPIDVLELGCGTGRQFHCLRNVEQLVGIDVSQGMLDQAEHPVHENDAPKERFLVQTNFHRYCDWDHSFDFIYAVGVFGHGCELTPSLAEKITRWLTPGGTFFFDVADADELSLFTRIRKRVKQWLILQFPVTSEDWPLMWLTNERQLRGLLQRAGFKRIEIARRMCQMPCGKGIKLQVKARV